MRSYRRGEHVVVLVYDWRDNRQQRSVTQKKERKKESEGKEKRMKEPHSTC